MRANPLKYALLCCFICAFYLLADEQIEIFGWLENVFFLFILDSTAVTAPTRIAIEVVFESSTTRLAIMAFSILITTLLIICAVVYVCRLWAQQRGRTAKAVAAALRAQRGTWL